MKKNIYGTTVVVKSKGILIIGASGAGKSDIALRLIFNHQAKLIADDRTDIDVISNKIHASAPSSIKGLLEVRGVGIISVESEDVAPIEMVVELVSEKCERMPERAFYELEGVKIPFIKLCASEISAPEKILAALSLLCGFKKGG